MPFLKANVRGLNPKPSPPILLEDKQLHNFILSFGDNQTSLNLRKEQNLFLPRLVFET